MVRFFGKVLIGSFVLANLALSYPTPVDFTGKLLRWNIDQHSPPVTYRVISDRTEELEFYRTLVEDAASQWSRVPSSYLQLEQVADEDHAHITVNIKSHLSGARFSSGYAIFDERDEQGPLHCLIEIVDGGSTLGLAKTILHELGHCVGLGHSLIPESIMSYQLDKNRYGLDTDDRAAITRLYPADGSAPQLPPGCAIRAHTSWPEVSSWLFMVLFCLPLMVCFCWRKHCAGDKPTLFMKTCR